MESTVCQVHRLVADVCVLAEQHVLLVRYHDTSNYDHERGWFLPDDFLVHLEHPDAAAKRILNEQGGISESQVDLSQIESFGNGRWHLVFHYRATPASRLALRPGANIAAAEWFALAALPDPAEVAHHGWALDVIGQLIASDQPSRG